MTETFGTVALVVFAWLVVFQILLVAGAPLGRLAWGGAHRVLPGRLRAASLLSAMLLGVGAATVAQALGLIPAVLPAVLLRPVLGTFAAMFGLSLVGNAASRSRPERWHGVPMALALVLGCGALAVSGP